MTKFLKLAILSLILAVQHSAAQTPARDLSLYDQSGPHEAKGLIEYHKMKSEVRAFIWSHWKEKRRGRIVVTLWTREGDPSTNTFFIEPDAQGQWQVVCEYTGIRYPRWGNKGPAEKFKGMDIYDVLRRRAFVREDPYLRRASDDEPLDGSEYELWLESSKPKDPKERLFLTL